ncbi:hypothetical protein PVIIG_05611 [Plasmodium vivax India VII]|uniref:PIR Superfamily Protein n=1 Tax=Plasmodium vivax India VII TaxID=1077284 RepID=A0A0J9UUI3_PLAVI|nr:hypothetical protein PVIIG_05611 [Plasmodium vivax India VII]
MDDQPYNNFCEYNRAEYPDTYKNYKKICLSFAKSIKYVVDEIGYSTNNDSFKEICSYLNYWLNSELRNVTKSNMDADEFYSKLNARPLSVKFHINKCHEHIKKIDNTVLGDLEYLYKLFLSMNSYRTSISINRTWDCAAANECYTSYNKRVGDCDIQDNTSFCEKLKEFHSTYNETMGTHMRQLFKRNSTEISNMNEENNEYSFLNSDYKEKNSETDTYNITYDQH